VLAHFHRCFQHEGKRTSRSRSGWLLPALPAGDEEWANQRPGRVRHTITSTLPNRTSLRYWLGGDAGINQGGEPFARETLALLTRGFKS
jgi:hypothetical protein